MNIIRLVSIVELIHFWSESGVHAVKLPRATMKHARDLCNFFFEPLSILVAVTIKPTIPSIKHIDALDVPETTLVPSFLKNFEAKSVSRISRNKLDQIELASTIFSVSRDLIERILADVTIEK